ncbi:MAG: adenylosuccinate synthase [Anaerolineae bacterium]|nr:adenylosuccinate synthase [Anaerolineae bacterium]
MPINVILGAQWGDEGKGKITDLLAAQTDLVARYGGGDNAGHTVTVGTERFALHLIPSGILYPRVTCLLGSGMVVNPQRLLAEMDSLAARGVDVSPARLKLSGQAHLILPYHIALDGAAEGLRGGAALGTTRRGIGPAYTDKAARTGIRAQELLHAVERPEALAQRVREQLAAKNEILDKIYGQPRLDETADAVIEETLAHARRLAPYIADVPETVSHALRSGKRILAEGAQGTLLDLDHGSYPYVTSSYPTVGGALIGLGVGPQHIERVVGVVKAYQTRVGAGPMPTELEGELADLLRGTGTQPWDEFGTTTGRPRRCGWLDAVTLRYAARVNGLTEIALTKLDVLSRFEAVKICVAYDLDGQRLESFPTDQAVLARCRPIYQLLPGWQDDIVQAQTFEDLPVQARDYVLFIEELLGIPASYISVGPGRDQTIQR